MKYKTFYVYECDAPGCGMEYTTVEQPLSCPYCDSTALDDEYKYKIKVEESE